MYTFRALSAEYSMNVSIERDGKPESSLDAVYSLHARYQNIHDCFFVTLNREEIKLDAKKKECDSLVDQIMQRLGNALFPITLIVSKNAEISGIKNFEEIIARWDVVANDILKESYSIPTEKYINMARTNMVNERTFIEAFSQQTFTQLLFRDQETKSFWLTTKNISEVCSSELVRCDRIGVKNNRVCFESVGDWDNECRFEYIFSDLGDVSFINGYVRKEFADEGGFITKNISLTVDHNRREAKRANKLMSFLFD